jgi:hypothetical protein
VRATAVRRVADGTRTRDHRDHNPGLYQLSYRHRGGPQDSGGQAGLPGRGVDECGPRAYPGSVVVERKEAVMKDMRYIAFRLDAALR